MPLIILIKIRRRLWILLKRIEDLRICGFADLRIFKLLKSDFVIRLYTRMDTRPPDYN